MVMRHVHPLLPAILKVHSDFTAALEVLNRTETNSQASGRASLSNLPPELLQTCLRPQTGVKIGRPDFSKFRSLQYCLQMAGCHAWIVMPKYDGEYCQIHVDLERGFDCIQIFSESGKDSTNDRKALHEIIRSCLRLYDKPRFSKRYILEGEMVVRDTRDSSILPFYKIRKHVSRPGTFLGTSQDSERHPHEQLGLFFYDLLLVDEEAVMHHLYRARRDRLRLLIEKTPCQIMTADMSTILFAKLKDNPARAERHILRVFSKSLSLGYEGLRLKPDQGAYLSLPPHSKSGLDGKMINIKLDYFGSIGDTADFAVIGASYHDGHGLSMQKLQQIKWTHFTIACLLNKEEVQHYDSRPIFKTMDCLSEGFVPERDMMLMSQHGQFTAASWEEDLSGRAPFDIQMTLPAHKGQVLFRSPSIVEVLGGSFDRLSSTAHYMLRHARIRKIHMDRGFEDVISFDALQEAAALALQAPGSERTWVESLRASLSSKGKYVKRSSPGSATSTTCSPKTPLSSERKRRRLEPNAMDLSSMFKISRMQSTSLPVSAPNTGRSRHAACQTLVRVNSVEMRDGDSRMAPSEPSSRDRKRLLEDATNSSPTKRSTIDACAFSDCQAWKNPEPRREGFLPNIEGPLCTALTDISNGSCPRTKSNAATSKFNQQRSDTVFHEMSSYRLWSDGQPHELDADRGFLPTRLQNPSPFMEYSIILPRSLQPSTMHERLIGLAAPARWIDDLRHWKREILPAVQPLGAVISESQADPGLQKALFVVEVQIEVISGLINEAMSIRLVFGERIEIWSWRILEELTKLELDAAVVD